jgi:hypothetical protein
MQESGLLRYTTLTVGRGKSLYTALPGRMIDLETIVRLYSLHSCYNSLPFGAECGKVKHMERLFVVPKSIVRHLMPLGNKRVLDTA